MKNDLLKCLLTTSKFPGATIRLSMTLLILVTKDKMEACDRMNKHENKLFKLSDIPKI